MDKHVVIIGSGLGGLTCGFILAKNGYKVTVLEKNVQIGGCLQTFRRDGINFETGIHYIGSMNEGQILHKLFNYLSLLPDVKLSPLDRSAYDIISIGGERFPFANGQEQFIDALAQYFPSERHNLSQYCKTIDAIISRSMVHAIHNDSELLLNSSYEQQSASEFIEAATPNKLLQKVLAGNLPLYAGIKNQTPIYIHALISDFYNKSAYRIVGGSNSISRSLAHSIRSMGGEVRSSSKVAKINCDAQKAVSISLENGEKIEGDYFISNIHPMRSLELLDTPLIRRSYKERIEKLQNTVSNFTVYIRFRKDTVPYLNSNFFHYTGNDIWNNEQYTSTEWPKNFLYMHLCSSAGLQYAEAAVLISYMNFSDVKRWKGTSIGRRGDDYEAFKQEKAERLLDELEKQMPGTRGNIEKYYTSTPLTYFDYTGTEEGSMYGLLRNCKDPVQTIVSQRTKIPNFMHTGQNINSHGILGVITGAIITSEEVLGTNSIMQQVKDLK